MRKLRLVRKTTPQTTRATPTLEERVAMVRAFVDAQRVRKDYKPGWFEEVETELRSSRSPQPSTAPVYAAIPMSPEKTYALHEPRSSGAPFAGITMRG